MVEDREHDAYLQAGHAVGAWLEGIKFTALSIIPDGEVCSWIDIDEPELLMPRHLCLPIDRESAKSIVKVLLSGPAAVHRYGFGRCPEEFSQYEEDLRSWSCGWRALNLAKRLGPGHAESLWRRVTENINAPEPWTAVSRLAASLLDAGVIPGTEATEVIRLAVERPKLRLVRNIAQK